MTVIDGFAPGKGAVPFLTSDGVAWAVFLDSTASKIMIYRDVDTTPVIAASVTAATANGAGPLTIDACVDGNDVVHLISMAEGATTRGVAYGQYFTGSDSFGTWEEIEAHDQPPSLAVRLAKIAVDEVNIPHAVWAYTAKVKGTPRTHVHYSVRTGGSWITPEQVDDLIDAADIRFPAGLAILEGNDVRAIWGEGGGTYSERERIGGTWGSAISNTPTDTESAFNSHITVNLAAASEVKTYVVEAVGNRHVFENGVQKVNDVFAVGERQGATLINNGASRFVLITDTNTNVVAASANNGTFTKFTLHTGVYTYVYVNYNTYHMHEDGTKVPYLYFENGASLNYGEWVYGEAPPPPPPRAPQQRTFPVIRPPRFPIRQLRI